MLEKFFKLKENGTTAKTEIIAGITSFMTMAYILAVNPSIMSAAGMDHGAVFTATAQRIRDLISVMYGIFYYFHICMATSLYMIHAIFFSMHFIVLYHPYQYHIYRSSCCNTDQRRKMTFCFFPLIDKNNDKKYCHTEVNALHIKRQQLT